MSIRGAATYRRRAPRALSGPHEDDLLGSQIRAGRVTRIQPNGLGVFRVATPPGWVLICAARQVLSDDLGDFGEGHLYPRTTCRAEMPFQPFILLASHHGDIMHGHHARGKQAIR